MQEFMILPTGASSFKEAMRIGSEVYHTLKGVIKKKYGQDGCIFHSYHSDFFLPFIFLFIKLTKFIDKATNVGDEGGFAPNIQTAREGLELLVAAIAQAGYTGKVSIGVDAAASEFYKDGKYDLDFKNPDSDPSKWVSSEQLSVLYRGFIADFPGSFFFFFFTKKNSTKIKTFHSLI